MSANKCLLNHRQHHLFAFSQASLSFQNCCTTFPLDATAEWSLGLQFPGISKYLLLYVLLAVAVRSWPHKPSLVLSFMLELRDIPPTHPAASVYVLGGWGPCSTTEIMHWASSSLAYFLSERVSSACLEPFIIGNDMFLNALFPPFSSGGKKKKKKS